MKKIYLSLCALAFAGTSFAQAIDNAGFETWRSSTAGSAPMPVVNLQAPTQWFGFDSVLIEAEETYLPLFLGINPTNLNAQVFQEATIVHSGTSAVKLLSRLQDTLGYMAGAISNAQPAVDPIALSGGDLANAIIYTGGTPTTLRITSVSAWIVYIPGKDSITHLPGNDTGTIVADAISIVGGVETIVGTGTLNMLATPTYTQMTVNLNYTDLVNPVSLIRIRFGSGQTFSTLDSSTMYVDDVSMVGVPQSVNDLQKAELVKVYPNPTSGIINISGPQNAMLNYQLVSISGQVVATKSIKGLGVLDISNQPSGMYFYNVYDASGHKVQQGKVSLNH